MSQAVEAYRGITALEEFRHLEILRERAKHDEAQAINNAVKKAVKKAVKEAVKEAEENAEKRRDEHWEGVVEKKDAEIEKLRQLIASLQANNKN